MKHPARAIALAVGVVLVGFAVLLASQVNASPQYKGGDLLGKPVPTFALPSLTGGPDVRSDNLRGRVVLVNFWNSWCIPCQQEHAALTAFYDRHRNDGDLEMIGIVRDDTAAAARSWVHAHHDRWSFVTDPHGQASLDFGTTGQPESYMISPNGVVVGVQRAPVTVANLEEMLAVAKRAA
ncbi:MAG: cytochrome c biosis protein CcmG, thiol:disulfide interchange protein DsbE [Actinomycetota bacterium]|jgi:cytochrome c biogenesis protein CcmG/thiol:disulfide interchange protein DsbE|nr:cytochrome c biosis protein CcmG, thiol:disulfide interchange protein DsbE [Actinomycetota bacterium]